MKPLNVAEDIITVGEAKTQLSRVLRVAQQRVQDAITRGLTDVDAGRTLTDAASDSELDEAFGSKRR